MTGPAISELVMIFLTIVILFSVSSYFWNLMSEVKKISRYTEAQTKIIAESAVKSGVEIDVISDILAQAGINKIRK